MPGDEKHDAPKETQSSQDEQLTSFLEEFEELTRDIEVRGFDTHRAVEKMNDFIQQVNEVDNISGVTGILHNLVMSWRSNRYLFTTDIISPILFLLERVTNEGVPHIHQHIDDILNYLNQNPLYSQSSDESASSQALGDQDDGVQQLSQAFGSQQLIQESVADNQYDPSLGALAYLCDFPAPQVIIRRNEGSEQDQRQHLIDRVFPTTQEGESLRYDNGYNVSSQNDINLQNNVDNNDHNIYQDHQPSPDWWVDSQPDAVEENSDAETDDEGYEEGKTDVESQTQHINFCPKLKFNSLPEGIFDKNSFYTNNNKDMVNDNIINDISFLNEINPKVYAEDDHGLQAYDIISLVALISIVSNAMTLIYEG